MARGQVISIFATGLGAVNPAVGSGEPAPSSPLSRTTSTAAVTIGGFNATVSFAGLAPGFVGLYQINATAPDTAPSGSSVPIALRIGGESSNVATVAIR